MPLTLDISMQAMNSFKQNNLSLKYPRSKSSDYKDTGEKFEFVAKTRFFDPFSLLYFFEQYLNRARDIKTSTRVVIP